MVRFLAHPVHTVRLTSPAEAAILLDGVTSDSPSDTLEAWPELPDDVSATATAQTNSATRCDNCIDISPPEGHIEHCYGLKQAAFNKRAEAMKLVG